MAQERIQKIMSEQGLCSRRAAEQIIAEGRVKINGHPVKVGDKMDPAKDILTVDGQHIEIQKDQQMYYLALYKPRGFVTTASDELGRKTVLDLVKDVPARVYPVGRLDKDSEGLLLLTNDGEFANAMMHPSGEITKLYRVTVRPHATEQQIVQLSQGIVLDDGTKTLPAIVNVVADEPERTVMEMTLREGKNREIRRMCEAVGLEVIRLKRSAEGAVRLGMLQPGEYRELTKQELGALRAASAKGRARTRTTDEQEHAARRSAGRGGRQSSAVMPMENEVQRRPQESAAHTGEKRTGYPVAGRAAGAGRPSASGGRPTGRGPGRSAGGGAGKGTGRPAGGTHAGKTGGTHPDGPRGPHRGPKK